MIKEPPVFSRQTVLAAIDLLEQLTQADFTRCLLKWGPSLVHDIAGESSSLAKRLNSLAIFIDTNPNFLADDGSYLKDVVVDEAAARFASPHRPGGILSQKQELFRRCLLLDNFTISDEAVRRRIPADLRASDAADDVTNLLRKHHFTTSEGHLRQAVHAHRRGDWAAANSQLRSFLEGLFDEIIISIRPEAANLPSSENRRAKLASEGFLFAHLNEWSGDGKSYIHGLMRRLHPHGSHPGLSDEEDSTFRLQIVVLTARLLLARYDAGRPV